MIRLIAAIDDKRGLARQGTIPWKLPTDVKRFRELTLSQGGNVVMGRRTFDQMSDYLKGRTNYIVSRHHVDLPENCVLVNDIDKFISEFKEDLWVIGGGEIFNMTIDKADELYLTLVEGDFSCDTFFPAFDEFDLASSEGPFEENQTTFRFNLYRPKS